MPVHMRVLVLKVLNPIREMAVEGRLLRLLELARTQRRLLLLLLLLLAVIAVVHSSNSMACS